MSVLAQGRSVPVRSTTRPSAVSREAFFAAPKVLLIPLELPAELVHVHPHLHQRAEDELQLGSTDVVRSRVLRTVRKVGGVRTDARGNQRRSADLVGVVDEYVDDDRSTATGLGDIVLGDRG